MPIPEDMMTEYKSPQELHNSYVKKLTEIGDKLGFATTPRKTSLGYLDCVWRIRNQKLPKVNENLPMVAFEVVCSEKQKSLKGSMSNLIVAKPSLAIFCLIHEGIKKSVKEGNPDDWLNGVEKYVEKMQQEFGGIIRIAVWNETEIDNLYDRTMKPHKL